MEGATEADQVSTATRASVSPLGRVRPCRTSTRRDCCSASLPQDVIFKGISRRSVGRCCRERVGERNSEHDCKFKALLAEGVRINIIFDEWTSRAKEAVLVTTVTWCEDDGELRRAVTSMLTVDVDLVSVNAAALRAMLEARFAPLLPPGVGLEYVFATVTTDTTNLPLAVFNDLPWLRNHCICHIIDLIIGDTQARDKDGRLKKSACAPFVALIKDIKKVMNVFAFSSKARRALKVAFKGVYPHDTALMPIYDVATRWSSLFMCALRFMELWAVLQKMSADQLGFTVPEWDALRNRLTAHVVYMPQMVHLLSPFAIWTDRLQTGDASVIGYTRVAARQLRDVTSEAANAMAHAPVQALAASLHASVLERLEPYLVEGGDRTSDLAEFLDPRVWATIDVVTPATSEVMRRLMGGPAVAATATSPALGEYKGVIAALVEDLQSQKEEDSAAVNYGYGTAGGASESPLALRFRQEAYLYGHLIKIKKIDSSPTSNPLKVSVVCARGTGASAAPTCPRCRSAARDRPSATSPSAPSCRSCPRWRARTSRRRPQARTRSGPTRRRAGSTRHCAAGSRGTPSRR
jgi:hypothetical protein